MCSYSAFCFSPIVLLTSSQTVFINPFPNIQRVHDDVRHTYSYVLVLVYCAVAALWKIKNRPFFEPILGAKVLDSPPSSMLPSCKEAPIAAAPGPVDAPCCTCPPRLRGTRALTCAFRRYGASAESLRLRALARRKKNRHFARLGDCDCAAGRGRRPGIGKN